MTPEEIAFMEVKPKDEGMYFVTLVKIVKRGDNPTEHIRDWLFYDGVEWDYREYQCCYVCFIREKGCDE
jgi:hypothetical protein